MTKLITTFLRFSVNLLMKHPSEKSILTCTINTFFIEIVEMVSFQLGEELRRCFFVLSRAWDKEKLFLSKKHYAIDIADPSSMQDACHMNFVIDFTHRRVSVVQC